MGPPARLRLTVAVFNVRALRVYERPGFREVARFVSTGSELGTEFVVMERPPG